MNYGTVILLLQWRRIRCGVESSAGFVDSGFIVRDDWGGMCYAVGRSDWYPLVEGVLIASEFYVGR